jgi:hypothetical protein
MRNGLRLNSKSKVLFWLIENYQSVKNDRDVFFQKMNSQARELVAVKKVICQRLEAEAWLKDFSTVSKEGVIDEK